MTLQIVPFAPWHALRFRVQEEQEHETHILSHELPRGAITIMHDNTTPMLIGGLSTPWTGRAVAWSLVSRYAGPVMRGLTRCAKNYIDSSGHRRIEMYVRATFEHGHRWAKMLGFRKACDLPDFKPYEDDGFRDETMYERILPWAPQL